MTWSLLPLSATCVRHVWRMNGNKILTESNTYVSHARCWEEQNWIFWSWCWKEPRTRISLEPFASTMCRSIYTCSSGLTRRSGCTRKASYVDTEQNHQRLHLDLDTQSHTDLLQSLLLLLSCSIQFRPIYHAKPTKLPGLVFRFAVLAQPAWSGRTAVLTGHATSKTHEIPQLPCFLLSLTVLSKPITYWLLLCSLHSCVWKIFYANTRLYVTSQSGPPTPNHWSFGYEGFNNTSFPDTRSELLVDVLVF